jgi:hypothetical protein
MLVNLKSNFSHFFALVSKMGLIKKKVKTNTNQYSEVSNKHGVFLILFEKIFPTLLEPPCLLISEKPATNTGFFM